MEKSNEAEDKALPYSWRKSFSLTGRLQFLFQCAGGVALCAVLALAGDGLALNLSTISILYLLLVVAYAVRFGFWQASIVSLAALLCQVVVFAPPAYSVHIADPKNAIAMVVFELAALLVSRVSLREKQYAIDKENKRRNMERLYSIGRGALVLDMTKPQEQQMANLIQREFGVETVAIVNQLSGVVALAGNASAEVQARIRALTTGEVSASPATISERSLRDTHRPMGTLLIAGTIAPLAMDSLGSLVSLTLDRHKAFVNEGVSEAARQTEQLRTTVLDGLAHAFKTPLTIIRAASSGLLEIGNLDDLQGELAMMIDEQSTRLDNLATRLLKTAHTDSEKLCLSTEPFSVSELIEEVVQEVRVEIAEVERGGSGPMIEVEAIPKTLQLTADYRMLAGTVKELLTNAVKYSDAGSPIQVNTTETAREMVISVRNQGAIIKTEDRERIFERYYRGTRHHDSAPGTGIGLSVARGVTEAHGGQIWVVSNEKEGTTFHMSLPKEPMMRHL